MKKEREEERQRGRGHGRVGLLLIEEHEVALCDAAAREKLYLGYSPPPSPIAVRGPWLLCNLLSSSNEFSLFRKADSRDRASPTLPDEVPISSYFEACLANLELPPCVIFAPFRFILFISVEQLLLSQTRLVSRFCLLSC